MGDFFAFVAHHVFASLLGALGMILSALGFAEQANAIVTRFKAWQLQALGAAFFFVAVIMVLVSYDSERHAQVTDAQSGSTRSAMVASQPEAGVLPPSVSAEYVDLMARGATDLQIQRFLKINADKSMDLSLELVGIQQSETELVAQFRAGEIPGVFATFAPEWGDYLQTKGRGDIITFRAKIVAKPGSRFGLGEGRPL